MLLFFFVVVVGDVKKKITLCIRNVANIHTVSKCLLILFPYNDKFFSIFQYPAVICLNKSSTEEESNKFLK